MIAYNEELNVESFNFPCSLDCYGRLGLTTHSPSLFVDVNILYLYIDKVKGIPKDNLKGY